MLRSLRNLVIALTLPSACGALPQDRTSAHGGDLHGGQTGSETFIACGEETATILSMDEVSEAGFSARALVGHVMGSYQQDWTWSDGTVTAATLTLEARSGEARWYDVEAEDGGAELAALCEARLEVPATLSLTTDDGQLNERWSVRVLAAELNDVSVQQTEAILTLKGSFNSSALEQHLQLVIDSYAANFRISHGAASGSLVATAHSAAGGPPDSITESHAIPLGEFGAPSENDPATE